MRKLFVLATLLLAGTAFAQWQRAEIDGQQLCLRETGEQYIPTSQAPSWVTYTCRVLNAVEEMLGGSLAEAQVSLARGSSGAVGPVTPPDEPGTYTATDIGDSESADCAEGEGTLDVDGDGTTDEFNGGLCSISTSEDRIEIIARFTGFDSEAYREAWSLAGPIVIDSDKTSTSAYSAILIPHQGGGGVPEPWSKRRSQSGGSLVKTSSPDTNSPVCLALQFDQSDGLVRHYYSTDMTCSSSSNWIEAQGSPHSVSLGSTYEYGFFASSHSQGDTATAQFEQIQISTTWTISTDPPPPQGEYNVIDLGDSTSAACNEVSDTEIDVTGDGTTDELNGGFCYKVSNSPELQVIARFVEFDSSAHREQYTFAGLLLIDSADDADSAYGAVQYSYQGGGTTTPEPSLKYRSSAGLTIGKTPGSEAAAPECLAFTWRQSTQTFRAFRSSDSTCNANATWTELAPSPVTLQITAPYAYGFAVMSHALGESSVATFDSISVSTTITIDVEDPVDPPPPPEGVQYPLTHFQGLGGISSMWGSDANQILAILARHKQLTLGGDFTGSFTASTPVSREDIVSDIKARAATYGHNIYITQYFLTNETYPLGGSPGPRFMEYYNLVNSHNCWAYLNGTSGPIAQSVWNSTWPYINVTTGCSTMLQQAADLFVGLFLETGDGIGHDKLAAPSLDGLFWDNHFICPRADWDWNRDGVRDSRSSQTFCQALRGGFKIFYERFKQVAPDYDLGGNWDGYDETGEVMSPLEHIGEHTLIEGLYGKTWSHHNFWVGHKILAMLRKAVSQTNPNGTVFTTFGTGNTNPHADANEMRERVYYTGLTQIAGVYASNMGTAHNINLTSLQWAWIPEYDPDNNGSYNWMGDRISGFPNCNLTNLTCTGGVTEQGDILKYEWDNAWIVCNMHDAPYTNRTSPLGSTKTTTLPDNVQRLSTGQTANTGATHTAGSNISVPDRTCLFLKKL